MSTSAKQQFFETFTAALADDEAQALRERVARDVPAALDQDGLRLLIHHELGPDAAGVGFATATLMTAELGAGTERMFEAGLWYSGAALVRQLVECVYLLTLMSESRDEAAAWMKSSHDEIVKRFMPRHLKKRAVSNFRPSEYEKHCDIGGHPNPAGRMLLRPNAGIHALAPRCYWLDLAQHLSDAWESFVTGLALYDPRQQPGDQLCRPGCSPEHGVETEALIAEWREADHVALTVSIPDLSETPA